jgi:uncharacterized protein
MFIFLGVAFGAAWLVALPLWIGGIPLDSVYVVVLGAVMMLTPAAGVVAVRAVSRRRGVPAGPKGSWRKATGVGLGPRTRRTLVVCALTWVGVPLLVVAALAVSVLVGALAVDLQGFSLYRDRLGPAVNSLPMDVRSLVLVQVLAGVVQAPLLNGLFAFGEEWGWRGWLLPELVDRWGRWSGLALTGVVWGLWHAPLTLRGYDYPGLGAWAAPYFVVFCVLFGIVIGWLRLATGSVWPAVIAHASLNGTAGLILLVGDAARPPNTAVAGITGVVGWVLLGAVCLALPRVLPVRDRVLPVREPGSQAAVGEGQEVEWPIGDRERREPPRP